MRVLNGVAEVRAAVGQHLGFSDYRVVDQRDVDAFAALTLGIGDTYHRWETATDAQVTTHLR